eukprot:TRINITY_DN70869_c0_g1_i1.p1 TRINITY_DN70869_c0_g1~~TRINITY_DN70869_c0_g1_i1.p1  ORF type:complete len:143 (+),score=23.33 TRINITY_DN70869_c0_g1_i1:50-478(+)
MKLAVLAVALMLPAALAQSNFAGVTNTTYDGAFAQFHDHNGYDDMRDACNKEIPNSHVCFPSELGVLAQYTGLGVITDSNPARYIDLSAASVGGTTVTSDCNGWTSNAEDVFSRCLQRMPGGPVLPSICRCSDPLAVLCCKN